jgi:Mg-chelatase subunit ChlI
MERIMSFTESFKSQWNRFSEWAKKVDGQTVAVVDKELHLSSTASFEAARQQALAANATVVQQKSLLQESLIKARDLHNKAAELASEALKSAEADVDRLKALAAAHRADAKELAGQITVPAATEVAAAASEEGSTIRA